MQYIVRKTRQNVDIRVDLPSSKSISNRLLIMSALSGGKMEIKNLSDSDDTLIMRQVLNSAGSIKNAGHAGTAMRFLTAYFALVPGEVILTGSERMKDRPVGELVESLRKLGAIIEYTEKEGYPPLRITGGAMKGGNLSVFSGVSSQFITALMMIGPCLEGGLRLELTGETISSSYIGLTLGLMQEAGIGVKNGRESSSPFRKENIVQGSINANPTGAQLPIFLKWFRSPRVPGSSCRG